MQRHEEGGGRSLRASDEEGGAGGRRSLRAGGRGRARAEDGAEDSRSRRGRRRGFALAPRTADARRSRRRRELQVRSFPFLLSFSLSPNGQIDERAVDFSTWPSISPLIDFPPASSVSFPPRSISARARLWRPPHHNRTPTGRLPTPRRRLGPKADAIRA